MGGVVATRQVTEYPLSKRGIVLIQGANRRDADADADPDLGDLVDLDSDLGISAGTDGSNGAGKTTLAMAPLWALTGSTDARAGGRPIDARGVIHEGADRATVTLRGTVSAPADGATDAGVDGDLADGLGAEIGADRADRAGCVPFELTRTMTRREHALVLRYGGEVIEGTLAQVLLSKLLF